TSAFILLSAEHLIPAWVVILIITREFLITGLRLLASSKGIILPAERLGKHKTAWQIITIIYFLSYASLAEIPMLASLHNSPALPLLGKILILITTLLTLYSGAAYYQKNKNLLLT
ncbi:MAG: hypothetical protein NZL93_03615, partial [Chthoniobacterales bacterium]|nr:hypothetical protein [Chthoniobacterales bacterium]